jgi:hypothetical protein
LYIQQSYAQNSPKKIFRSQLFSLSTISYFACNFTYSLDYIWSLRRVDIPKIIDLTKNPTFQSSELVIQSNTLDFGVYEFIFKINVVSTDLNNVSNTANTFIQIIPSGLAIFGLQNGISSQLVGSSQSFILNPGLYSLDLDYLLSMNKLNYTFYCNSINSNRINSSSKTTIDLATYKKNPQLAMQWNDTCFDSNSKILQFIFIYIFITQTVNTSIKEPKFIVSFKNRPIIFLIIFLIS